MPSVDAAQRRALGLTAATFGPPWMVGPIGAKATIKTQGGTGRADVVLDLSRARIRLPDLGWTKERQTTGTATVGVLLKNGAIAAIPNFAVTAGDLTALGSVAFTGAGKPRTIQLRKLAFGRTDLAATIAIGPAGGVDIRASGKAFDAHPVISGPPMPDQDSAKPPPPGPPLTLSATVKTLYLSQGGALTDATLTARRTNGILQAASLDGTLTSGKSLTAVVQRDKAGQRILRVASEDAGGVLRAFGLFNDMVGGRLRVDGLFDDDNPRRRMRGTVHIDDYSVVHTPLLARLLTVAALTGVVDLLRGQGIAFASLTAPFTLDGGRITLTNARTSGASLGLTANGQIDTDNGRMAVNGTIVPVYALNSILGRIPVLGWLITGGEKGGGVVAFNFSMTGSLSNPDVSVNPLSALTPGFLRQIFSIFDAGLAPVAPSPTSAPVAPSPSSVPVAPAAPPPVSDGVPEAGPPAR
jgi:hypothetical protein